MNDLLTWTVFTPLVGALVVMLTPKKQAQSCRLVGLLFSLLAAVFGGVIYHLFDPEKAVLQLAVDYSWLLQWGVRYHLAVDGLNISLVLMTLLLTPLAILASWSMILPEKLDEQRASVVFLLMMEAGALGTFLSQDLFLFYVFWELILIPAFLFLGMYGSGDRRKTAMQFFVYTFGGSLLMFFAILYLIWQHQVQTGVASAAIADLIKLKFDFDSQAGYGLLSMQGLLFVGVAMGFFVKAPLVPFHGWLYSTYKNAPVVLTIFLSAILSKMGTYGVLKVLLPMFPQATVAFTPVLLWVAAVGIVYGALLSLVQNDLKSMVAYASLSHVSGILFGLFSLNANGTAGALFLMFSHGIIIFGLFFVAGILEKRHGSVEFSKLGGLARIYPWLAIAFFILTLATVSLPGTNGFVGEFLILAGGFAAAKGPAILAVCSVVLSAAYMLRGYQLAMLGSLNSKTVNRGDLRRYEKMVFAILVVLILGLGVYPKILLAPSELAVGKGLINQPLENPR